MTRQREKKATDYDGCGAVVLLCYVVSISIVFCGMVLGGVTSHAVSLDVRRYFLLLLQYRHRYRCREGFRYCDFAYSGVRFRGDKDKNGGAAALNY